MKPNVDLKKLRAFYFVAKHGSLSGAAVRLALSTSAISMQINQLEAELGTKLFHRIGRKLILGPTGRTFLEQVERALLAVDGAVASVSRNPGEKQRISVAIGADLTRLLSAAIGRFIQNHPEIDLSIHWKHSPETLLRMQDGSIDMAIGYFRNVPKGFERRTLMKRGFSIFYSTSLPIAKIEKPTLRDISNCNVIGLRRSGNQGRQIIQTFRDEGMEVTKYIETDNSRGARELAAQGIGIAILNSNFQDESPSPGTRIMDVTNFFGSVNTDMIYCKARPISKLHRELFREMQKV